MMQLEETSRVCKIYLKEGVEVQTQKKPPKEWSSLTPSKPATTQYCVQGVGFLVKFLKNPKRTPKELDWVISLYK